MKKSKRFQMNKVNWQILLLIFSVHFCFLSPLQGQKKERTRLRAYYEKLPNKNKQISVILTQGRGKNMRGVKDAEIEVSIIAADSTIVLGSLTTDSKGESVLLIESNYKFPLNEELYSMIGLVYEGNDSLRGSDNEIEFQNLQLRISTFLEDSTKYVEVAAFQFDNQGNQIPAEELGARVGVKRLYNNLYLGEIETDEEGKAIFEFPDDIPGDSVGNITIGVVLQDHDDFGTVSSYVEADWGIPVDFTISSNGRSLFGDSAPVWMITAVAIILVGAWFHFLWAVYLVVKIKKTSLIKG